MNKEIYAIPTKSGRYIPKRRVPNSYFLKSKFYGPDKELVKYSKGEKKGQIKPVPEIVATLVKNSGIENRFWARWYQKSSTLAFHAAKNCLASPDFDKDSIDILGVTCNFEDTLSYGAKLDLVPPHASRLKHNFENELRIDRPDIISFDLIGYPDTLDKVLEHITYNKPSFVIGRYMGSKSLDSDFVFEVAKMELRKSKIDFEGLEQVIVVHESPYVECSAEKLKKRLRMNPNTLAYVLVFGCPGFVLLSEQANQFIQQGFAKRVLDIATEILSRYADDADMDKQLYADAAGAVLYEAVKSDVPLGIIATVVKSFTKDDYAYLLRMGESYDPNYKGNKLFLKMDGNELFKVIVRETHKVIKECLDKASKILGRKIHLKDINLIPSHQANLRMNISSVGESFKSYGLKEHPSSKMPMIISQTGNPSVASIPLIYDLILKKDYKRHELSLKPLLENYEIKSGDLDLDVAMGAGTGIAAQLKIMP